MLQVIKRYIPASIKLFLFSLSHIFFDLYAIKCYSQEGEDMILRRIFEEKNGFYVDVGAHHPRRFSNTYYFYKQGWTGISIEPNPQAAKAFKSDRPRDINLCIGVSDTESILKYYYFDEPALNTFDSSVVKSRLADTLYKVIGHEDFVVDRLDNILKKHLPTGQSIDFYQESGTGASFASTNSVVGTPGRNFRTTNSVVTAMKTASGWLVFGDLSA